MPEIVASVDPNILREIPRFFGGWTSALGELLQNAHRGGATGVDITFDRASGVLSITDNGSGIADPSILLRAGASGWNESVVDPAGMGFFAHLAFVTASEVTSGTEGKRWRLRLTPKVLSGTPARWDPIPNTGGETGTRIDLMLKPGTARMTDEDLKAGVTAARGWYPFTLRLNGAAVPPKQQFEPLLEVRTQAGLARVGARESVYRDGFHAVWEHRSIGSEISGSTAFKQAMEAAGKKSRRPRLAENLTLLQWEWFIDPLCGVRPRLPDRSELIANEALGEACASLLDAVATCIEEAIAKVRALPEKIEKVDTSLFAGQGETSLKPALIQAIWRPIWEELIPGYVHVTWDNPTGFDVWHEEDGGMRVRRMTRWFYTRSAIGARSSDLEQTLNLLGHDTWLDPNAAGPKVTIRGLKHREESPDVAFADSITVEGIGSIPFILRDVERRKAEPAYACDESGRAVEIEPLILFAGTPDEFIRTLERGAGPFCDTFFLARHYQGEEWDWCDIDGDDVSVLHDAIRQELIGQVMKGFCRDRLDATEKYFATRAATDRLRSLRRDLTSAASEATQPFMARHGEIRVTLMRATMSLGNAEKLLEEECRGLRSKAGLETSRETGPGAG